MQYSILEPFPCVGHTPCSRRLAGGVLLHPCLIVHKAIGHSKATTANGGLGREGGGHRTNDANTISINVAIKRKVAIFVEEEIGFDDNLAQIITFHTALL